MKRILFFLSCFCIWNLTTAQNAIPNPGFETWNVNPNYDDPAGWGTINGLTYFLGVRTVTKATAAGEFHSGTAAIKLESKTVPLQGVAPGIAATGTINPNTQAVDGGVAYSRRPISFTGWYRYEPSGTDTCSIDARLTKWNSGTGQRDQIGSAEFIQTTTVGAFTQFTVNFTYTSVNFPDTLVITLLTSSRATNSPVGTKLWVDDLAFVLCNPNYSATTTKTNATCTASNGSATVNPANGTPPYSFLWSTGATSNSIQNRPAATYTVTVTDANACTVTASAVIASNTTPLNVTATATASTSCSSGDGSVTASSSNGAPNFTYVWSTGASTQTVNNLGAGTYTVTINDSNGCSGTGSATVTAPNGPSATAVVNNVACNGGSTGAINITASGGTGSLTYLWSNGVTTEDISNVGGGNYCVTVTDANSCSFQTCESVTEPAVLSASETHTNVLCNGANTGSITLTPAGGTLPYSITWSSSNGSNLAAGTYTATVTDANSCSATVSVSIVEPAALTVSLTATDATSSTATDGAVNAGSAGGTPPFSYLWDNGATTQNLTAVAAGEYCLIVTDANNCTATACDTVSAPSSINTLSADIFSVYPNPAVSNLMVEIKSSGSTYSFTVFSVEGKLVEEKLIGAGANVVDVRVLPSGLYTYRLKDISSGETGSGLLNIER